MMRPTSGSTIIVQAAAVANNLKASELNLIGFLGQPVAEAANGLDQVTWNLLAQSADEHLDRVAVTIEILIVEMLDELRTRHHPAVMMHQIGQEAIFVRGELDGLPGERHPGRLGIKPQWAALDLALGMSSRPAHLSADACQQFLHMERLGDIIVGARIHAGDLVAPPVAGGEDDHRHLALGTPPLLEDANTVHLRQPQVEDYDIVGLGIAEMIALLTVPCRVDGITGPGQSLDELTIEIGIIFNNKGAHVRVPGRRSEAIYIRCRIKSF